MFRGDKGQDRAGSFADSLCDRPTEIVGSEISKGTDRIAGMECISTEKVNVSTFIDARKYLWAVPAPEPDGLCCVPTRIPFFGLLPAARFSQCCTSLEGMN